MGFRAGRRRACKFKNNMRHNGGGMPNNYGVCVESADPAWYTGMCLLLLVGLTCMFPVLLWGWAIFVGAVFTTVVNKKSLAILLLKLLPWVVFGIPISVLLYSAFAPYILTLF